MSTRASAPAEDNGASRASTPPAAVERLAYSVPEAIQAAGVGRTLLYRAIARGELQSVKKGGRRLVPVEALRRWLAA